MIRGVIQDAPKLGLRSTFRRQPAGNGASLDLNFMTGVLPPGVVFTRSNTLGYTDVNGQAKTAGVNQPRLTAQGLMINDAATVGALEIARVNDMAWFNHAAGTFLVEFSVTTLAAGVNTGLSIDDATGNERHVLRVSGGSAGPIVLDGGVSQAQPLHRQRHRRPDRQDGLRLRPQRLRGLPQRRHGRHRQRRHAADRNSDDDRQPREFRRAQRVHAPDHLLAVPSPES